MIRLMENWNSGEGGPWSPSKFRGAHLIPQSGCHTGAPRASVRLLSQRALERDSPVFPSVTATCEHYVKG